MLPYKSHSGKTLKRLLHERFPGAKKTALSLAANLDPKCNINCQLLNTHREPVVLKCIEFTAIMWIEKRGKHRANVPR